jgi:hypothetical protein
MLETEFIRKGIQISFSSKQNGQTIAKTKYNTTFDLDSRHETYQEYQAMFFF